MCAFVLSMDQPSFFKKSQMMGQGSDRYFAHLLKLAERELFLPVCQEQLK